ncbi:MAG: DUF3822 family protein [Prevotellaceae bacterium]|jgi:hypothetical protein|nr:DUF3822 family protein [Prevotellaceae bacterium]
MFTFIDTTFDCSQTNGLHLSGQVDAEGFAFAVTDGAGAVKALKRLAYPHAVLSYDDEAKELAALFEQEPLLHQTYKSGTWTFFSNKATLIPAAFADTAQLRTCLAYAAPLDELDEIHYRTLPDMQAMLVFAVPSPQANVILKYQPGTRFVHPHVQLLSQFNSLDGHDRLVLHLAPSLADVELYRDNALLLSNTYAFTAFTDVVYYLAFILQQYRLRTHSVTLYYMGAVQAEQQNLLHRYFRNVKSVYTAAAGLQVGAEAAATYHSLLTLPQCE